MRLLTWNVNSVRLRLELLRQLAEAARPDVLCLQETKVADPLFPRQQLADLGYHHLAVAGMKSYNGVAIASRLPLSGVTTRSWCGREDCRHLIATVAGIELHCLYVPAGGDIPDPDANDKFAHKLDFLDALTEWFGGRHPTDRPIVLLGDLNIAPLETDVWSHRQLLTVVSHTPVEVARLAALQASLGWVDAVRHFIPPEVPLFSWWSYRATDWAASDRGRRLDHVWVTPSLVPRLTGAMVLREVRGWQPASDHVPVMVDLEG
jgi:exodeoxyribonuclease-3